MAALLDDNDEIKVFETASEGFLNAYNALEYILRSALQSGDKYLFNGGLEICTAKTHVVKYAYRELEETKEIITNLQVTVSHLRRKEGGDSQSSRNFGLISNETAASETCTREDTYFS